MNLQALNILGWSPEWAAAQAAAGLAAAGLVDAQPYRVASLHKSRAECLGAAGGASLTFAPSLTAAQVAVGDWVLAVGDRIAMSCPRQSHLTRRAAGTGIGVQLIAANVDVMLIVTACGPEFNTARLERYLVLSLASGIAPVIVLTKADLLDPAPFVAQAIACGQGAPVLALNGKTDAGQVLAHIGRGKTAVLMGSSGVGKSTLANGLLGAGTMATADVRAQDGRGRHTTTARHLLALPHGGWLIDTPGVRELQLADVAGGIDLLFGDILTRAQQCRFRDCAHLTEPGCAVQDAIARGELDAARLARWQKLRIEQTENKAALQSAQTRKAGQHTKKSASKHQPYKT